MNNFIVSLLVTICLSTIKHKQPEDMILWGEKTIQWEDFKGAPPENYNTTHGAYTITSIKVAYSGFKGKIPNAKVLCYFVKDESWTLLNDDYSLEHERLHFDVAEIHARKIRRAFDSLRTNYITDISIYKGVVKLYGEKQEEFNHKYDGEVYGNKQKQAEWNTKIKKELKVLEEYGYLPFND